MCWARHFVFFSLGRSLLAFHFRNDTWFNHKRLAYILIVYTIWFDAYVCGLPELKHFERETEKNTAKTDENSSAFHAHANKHTHTWEREYRQRSRHTNSIRTNTHPKTGYKRRCTKTTICAPVTSQPNPYSCVCMYLVCWLISGHMPFARYKHHHAQTSTSTYALYFSQTDTFIVQRYIISKYHHWIYGTYQNKNVDYNSMRIKTTRHQIPEEKKPLDPMNCSLIYFETDAIDLNGQFWFLMLIKHVSIVKSIVLRPRVIISMAWPFKRYKWLQRK